MSKIIVANWKSYPETLVEAIDLFRVSSGAIVCPPFKFLEELSKIDSNVILGAQDIESGQILGELGVKYVIIGHSDRRWKLGESDLVVNKKLKLALEHNIIPIVCIGEKVRDKNFPAEGGPASGWKDFLKNQVESTFTGMTKDEISKSLIVYEPVWAISTTPGAKPDTPESAFESVAIIKEFLNSDENDYLYGGSVSSKNIIDFLSRPEFSGVLVGGASIDKEEFPKILSLAWKI